MGGALKSQKKQNRNQNPKKRVPKSSGNPSGQSNVETFIRFASKLQSLLAAEGQEIRIAKGESPGSFAALPSALQSSQLAHFTCYVDVCSELKSEGSSLRDSQKLVLKMITKMGLCYQKDVLEKIKDDHIIEIYNKDNIQTFRNLNFFAVCSYSLDELLSEPWWKLFHREDEINRQLFYHASSVLTGDRKETFAPDVPTHLLQELNSPRSYRMSMSVDYLSPLFREGHPEQVEQALAIETARLLI